MLSQKSFYQNIYFFDAKSDRFFGMDHTDQSNSDDDVAVAGFRYTRLISSISSLVWRASKSLDSGALGFRLQHLLLLHSCGNLSCI